MSSHYIRPGISGSRSQAIRSIDGDNAGICRKIYPQIGPATEDCQAAREKNPIDVVQIRMPGAYPKADENSAYELTSAVTTPASQPISCSRRLSNASACSAVTSAAGSRLHDDVHTLQEPTDATENELATQARHARLDAAINREPSILSPALISSAIGQIASFIANFALNEGADMAVAAWTSTVKQSSQTFRLKEDLELFKPRLPDKDMVGAYMNRERGCFTLNDASLSKFCVYDLELILKDAEGVPLSDDVSPDVQDNRSRLTAIFRDVFECRPQKGSANEIDFLTWLESGRFGDHEEVAVALYYEAAALERARCHIYALVHREATRNPIIEAVPVRRASTNTIDETLDESSTQDQALFFNYVESSGLCR